MSRFYYLVTFLLKNYQRATNLIIEGFCTAIVAGIIFDPRYRPYTDEYVLLAKSIFLIVFGVLVSYRLSKVHYTGQISMLLSRVTRQQYYLASIVSTMLVVIFFSLLLDIYLLVIIQIRPSLLFGLTMLMAGFFDLVLGVLVAHMFTIYIVKDLWLRLLAPVIIGLGALPGWYSGLPLEKLFQFISYIFPPLHTITTHLMQNNFHILTVVYPAVYSGLVLILGIKLFMSRSLTNLQR